MRYAIRYCSRINAWLFLRLASLMFRYILRYLLSCITLLYMFWCI
ncbi:hypothetical protein HMPREF1584_00438 [Gardnerella vaginalis JCP8481A]|nr:hypothetical protein HMPREF1584_00438 [Gardnerella vaginalis JCP8481A]